MFQNRFSQQEPHWNNPRVLLAASQGINHWIAVDEEHPAELLLEKAEGAGVSNKVQLEGMKLLNNVMKYLPEQQASLTKDISERKKPSEAVLKKYADAVVDVHTCLKMVDEALLGGKQTEDAPLATASFQDQQKAQRFREETVSLRDSLKVAARYLAHNNIDRDSLHKIAGEDEKFPSRF